jgi:methionyl-tRNA synthetase
MPADRKTFYITTPIYYVNAQPHLGHAYCTIIGDVMARYKRLRGFDVRYCTGTDEHGEKVAEAAAEAGEAPKAFCDRVSARFLDAWKQLDIQFDDFIRTTEPRHEQGVTRFIEKLKSTGDIYKGPYVGWYCVKEETFWPESKLLVGSPCPECERKLDVRDNDLWCDFHQKSFPKGSIPATKLCPNEECHRPVKKVEEENYFFRLSKYQEWLQKHFDANPDFIVPSHRKGEMLAVLRDGLQDVSVTRTTFKWGIPFPGDPQHVVYVWFEALMNYITGVDYAGGGELRRYWPTDVNLLGKDIARFHTLLWPAMLHAAGEPVMGRSFLTGMITNKGVKMSKSLGNVIDPFELAGKFGADVVRWTLIREVVPGNDGDFSNEALARRNNGELANGIGNLLSRTVSMIEKYKGGVVPPAGAASGGAEAEIPALAAEVVAAYATAMDKMAFAPAYDAVLKLVGRLDKYVDESAPWALAKAKDPKLDDVLYRLAEGLRIVSILVEPLIPGSARKMRGWLGVDEVQPWERTAWSTEVVGKTVKKGAGLFPKIEAGA